MTTSAFSFSNKRSNAEQRKSAFHASLRSTLLSCFYSHTSSSSALCDSHPSFWSAPVWVDIFHTGTWESLKISTCIVPNLISSSSSIIFSSSFFRAFSLSSYLLPTITVWDSSLPTQIFPIICRSLAPHLNNMYPRSIFFPSTFYFASLYNTPNRSRKCV